MFRAAKEPKEGKPKTKKSVNFKSTTVNVLVAAAIFLLGWGIGSNRINIGPYAGFHKKVATNAPAKLDYSSVDEVYNSLKQNYDGQLDSTKLTDGLKTGLVNSAGDPYTEYFNAKDAKSFNDELGGTFSGVGAELSKDDKNNIIVIAPIAGYPAEKAGIQPKDIIADIDGTSTANMSIGEAVDKIRGAVGTHVKLKIVRSGNVQDLDIVREQITVPSVDYKILDGNSML